MNAAAQPCPKCRLPMGAALRCQLEVDSLDPDCGAASSARVILCVACATAAIQDWAKLTQIAAATPEAM